MSGRIEFINRAFGAALSNPLIQALIPEYDLAHPRLIDPREGPGCGFDSFCNATVEYSKKVSGAKNLYLKTFYHGVDWAKLGNPNLPEPVMNARNMAKDIKNALGVTEIPGKLNEFRVSVENFVYEPSFANIGQVFFKGVDLVSPCADFTEFFSARIQPLPADTMKQVSTANAGALLISMSKSSVEDGSHFVNETYTAFTTDDADEKSLSIKKLALSLINLIKDVSYVALATIALLATFFAVVTVFTLAVSTAILICSTSALTFTIIGEYYKNIVGDPYVRNATILLPYA